MISILAILIALCVLTLIAICAAIVGGLTDDGDGR